MCYSVAIPLYAGGVPIFSLELLALLLNLLFIIVIFHLFLVQSLRLRVSLYVGFSWLILQVIEYSTLALLTTDNRLFATQQLRVR